MFRMDRSKGNMKQRIDYLEAEVKRVRKLYEKTLKYQELDPEVSLLQARKSAEAICKSIYVKEGLHKNQNKPLSKLMLNEIIHLLERNSILPDYIKINLRTIQAFGNYGSHYQPEENGFITADYIKPCLLSLATVFNWYVKEYYDNLNPKLLVEKDSEKDFEERGISTSGNNEETAVANNNTIKVVGNHAPPYRIFESKQANGFYFDIIKIIAERIKIDVTFIKKPYKTTLSMMKKGDADLMVGPNKTEEREKFMIFSQTTLPRERKGFYVHIKGKPILAYEDLYDRFLIVSRGKYYTDQIESDHGLKKITVSDYTQGFRLLVNDRAYVMIMPEKEGDYLVEKDDYDVFVSPFYLEGKPSHIAMSKKSKHIGLVDKIEKMLNELENEGVCEEVMHYY